MELDLVVAWKDGGGGSSSVPAPILTTMMTIAYPFRGGGKRPSPIHMVGKSPREKEKEEG